MKLRLCGFCTCVDIFNLFQRLFDPLVVVAESKDFRADGRVGIRDPRGGNAALTLVIDF